MSIPSALKTYNKHMAISSIISPTPPSVTFVSNLNSADNLTTYPILFPERLSYSMVSPLQSASSHLSCSVINSPDTSYEKDIATHSRTSMFSTGHLLNLSTQKRYHSRTLVLDYKTSDCHHESILPSHALFGLQYSSPPNFNLSQDERRQRNKTASAKYRAKKNKQQCEMRTKISLYTKENNLLQCQLGNARQENDRLKKACDKLRGKVLAEKMLKKLLNDTTKQPMTDDESSDDEKFGPPESMFINSSIAIKDNKTSGQLNLFSVKT
ncbi:unnamed protein product [Rhizopus stolonifer]